MSQALIKQIYGYVENKKNAKAIALLEANPDILNEWVADDTWLHVAAECNNIDLADYLLTKGLSINIPDKEGKYSPLSTAVLQGHMEMTLWLIEHGADVNFGLETNFTPVLNAIYNNSLEFVKTLHQHGANISYGHPMRGAVNLGRQRIIDYFKKHGVEEYIADDKTDQKGTDSILSYLEEVFEVTNISGIHDIIGNLSIYIVPPTESRNRYTLVTSGLSEFSMNVTDSEEHQYAELMIHLPADWRLDKKDMNNPDYFWPIKWLESIAYMLEDGEEGLESDYCIIANGEPPKPMVPDTYLTCMLLVIEDPDLWKARLDGKRINFYTMFPLFTEERDYEKKNGFIPLFQLFDEKQTSLTIDVNRKSVVQTKKFVN